MVLYFISNGFLSSLYKFSDCIVLHNLFGAAWISKVLGENELVSG